MCVMVNIIRRWMLDARCWAATEGRWKRSVGGKRVPPFTSPLVLVCKFGLSSFYE